MDYATRLAALCSREPGLTALLSLPAQGDAAVFWLLCTEAGMASMPRVLPRLAADAGALAASAPEGEGRELRHDPPELAVLLQRAENTIWLLLAHAARLADQNCLLEAAELTVQIRHRCLLPLLEHINGRFSGSECHRAGNYADQLLLTHPAADAESIKDALEAARQIYFALRYELANENFSRQEAVELEATRLLRP